MYVILGVIFLVMVWALASLAQKVTTVQIQVQDPGQQRQPFDRMKRRLELREEMHKRMMDRLMNGNAADPSMFKDLEQFLDESLKDSMSGIDSLGQISGLQAHFKSQWLDGESGRILEITPKNPGQQLDIDVNASQITIKGKTEATTENGGIVSSFSNAYSIPGDCDGTKVKMSQKDGKILVEVPYRNQKTISVQPKGQDRKPLPPSPTDVEI